MAKSKKRLLKRIDRTCKRLYQTIGHLADPHRGALLDELEVIWDQACHLTNELQRVHPGTLERLPWESSTVTCQHAEQLREQCHTFSQRVVALVIGSSR